MTAKYVKASIFPLQSQLAYDVFRSLKQNENLKYYYSENDSDCSLLELQAFNDLDDITASITNTDNAKEKLLTLLSGDIKSELLTLIDDPLNLNGDSLPYADIIQMRHIEVLPIIYNNYRKWRDQTIFEVVRTHKSIIKSFGAYHSLISSSPGVTFIAATDEHNLQQFDDVFTNQNYKDILVQAGDNFIIGGTKDGLTTKYYQSINKY